MSKTFTVAGWAYGAVDMIAGRMGGIHMANTEVSDQNPFNSCSFMSAVRASCYTMALCAQAGHEDAMLSFRDITAHTIHRLAETVRGLHRAGVAETGGGVG